uniref:Uncharacterized protein n=1 Tax=Solanum lycopersicum TaxID=4081 RepID=A0A3Q7J4Z0_SOLLC
MDIAGETPVAGKEHDDLGGWRRRCCCLLLSMLRLLFGSSGISFFFFFVVTVLACFTSVLLYTHVSLETSMDSLGSHIIRSKQSGRIDSFCCFLDSFSFSLFENTASDFASSSCLCSC